VGGSECQRLQGDTGSAAHGRTGRPSLKNRLRETQAGPAPTPAGPACWHDPAHRALAGDELLAAAAQEALVRSAPVTATPTVRPLTLDEARQLALGNHKAPALARLNVEEKQYTREAEQSIAKAEAALKVARMDYLPDVNVLGGDTNQTGASYIQQTVGYIGVSASYPLWE
jgi:outer membrane protein TolC